MYSLLVILYKYWVERLRLVPVHWCILEFIYSHFLRHWCDWMLFLFLYPRFSVGYIVDEFTILIRSDVLHIHRQRHTYDTRDTCICINNHMTVCMEWHTRFIEDDMPTWLTKLPGIQDFSMFNHIPTIPQTVSKGQTTRDLFYQSRFYFMEWRLRWTG